MPALSHPRSAITGCLLFSLAWLLAGCSEPGAPEAQTSATPRVTVETLRAEPAVITADLNGRLRASREAEVRARVAGIVLERLFEEGSVVGKGDLLFQIDPAPLQASVQSAEASLRRAEASRVDTANKEQRLQRLLANHSVSQQDYDSARGAALQAAAEVAAAEAALASARLDLGHATVKAPIGGRIGRAGVSEGALVGQGETTLLATIRQTDPIHADLAQPAEQYAALRRAAAENGQDEATDVALIQPDGEPRTGKLLFAEMAVDEGTGQVMLRSEFQNPQHDLLPGAFVQVRVPIQRLASALKVAQRAVQWDAAGQPFALVVNAQGRVERRLLVLGGTQAGRWIVREGLEEGERVIVAGLQHVSPGVAVEVDVAPDASDGGDA